MPARIDGLCVWCVVVWFRYEEGKLSSAKVESDTFQFRLIPYAKPSIQVGVFLVKERAGQPESAMQLAICQYCRHLATSCSLHVSWLTPQLHLGPSHIRLASQGNAARCHKSPDTCPFLPLCFTCLFVCRTT